MAIVKQEMSGWPGNNEKMASYSNLKLSVSKRYLGVDRGYLVNNH